MIIDTYVRLLILYINKTLYFISIKTERTFVRKLIRWELSTAFIPRLCSITNNSVWAMNKRGSHWREAAVYGYAEVAYAILKKYIDCGGLGHRLDSIMYVRAIRLILDWTGLDWTGLDWTGNGLVSMAPWDRRPHCMFCDGSCFFLVWYVLPRINVAHKWVHWHRSIYDYPCHVSARLVLPVEERKISEFGEAALSVISLGILNLCGCTIISVNHEVKEENTNSIHYCCHSESCNFQNACSCYGCQW